MYNDMVRVEELCKEFHIHANPFVFECEPNRRTVCVVEQHPEPVLKTAVIVFYDVNPETDDIISVIRFKLNFEDEQNEYKTHFPDVLTKVKITTSYDYKTLAERASEGNPLLDGLCDFIFNHYSVKIKYKYKNVVEFKDEFKSVRWKESFVSTYDKRREK